MSSADRDSQPNVTPRKQDGVTVYRVSPPRSAGRFVLALLVVSGFLSLVAVPVGWWLAGWTGALAGLGLSVLFFIVADGFTVREIRIFPDGEVEFRSLWRRTRVDGSRIIGITGYLDHDEGTRSFNIRVADQRGQVRLDDFPEFRAFVGDLKALNPELLIAGEWPSVDGWADRPSP